MIELCDMSSIQQLDQVDFHKVKASGIRGVWFRCTMYSGAHDDFYDIGAFRAHDAGLAVGAYHFCFMGSDPISQMEHFYARSQAIGSQPGDLPPMIDWEFCKNDRFGKPIPKDYSVAWLLAAAQRATELWYPAKGGSGDRLPLIYTYPYFAAERQEYLTRTTALTKYPLVLAGYKCPQPKPIKPWQNVTVWQYAGDDGRVPGVGGACDRDRFLGDEDAFRRFLGLEATSVPSELETGSGGIVRPAVTIPERDLDLEEK